MTRLGDPAVARCRRLVPPWEGGPDFLRVAEVAVITDADPRTVRRGIEAGNIPAVRLHDATWRVQAEPFWRQLAGRVPPESVDGEVTP